MLISMLKNVNITTMTRGDTGLAATNVDSTVLLDMSGYEGVMFVTSIVETTAGASTTGVELIPRFATTNAATALIDMGSTNIAGSGTAISTGDWRRALVVDVIKPTKRYISCSIDKDGNGTSQVGPVIAIQYNTKKAPITQSTTYVKEAVTSLSETT